MKRTAAALGAAVLVSVFALASCVSSWSDGGYLVIGFGGGDQRSVSWPPGPEEVARMVIKVALDGPGGARNIQVEGGTSVTIPLEPGRWKLRAEAFVDNKLRAVSDTEELEIKRGRNYRNITLKKPPALSLGAGGTHTFPARTAGYAAAPPAHTVTVSNAGSFPSGGLTVSLSGAGASAFVLSRTSLPGIPGRAGASFTVQPKPGQGVGTYAGTVRVRGEDMDESFDVGFRVFNGIAAPASTNLMLKFGVAGTDAAAVTETFEEIHNYLAGISAADLVAVGSPISLGDYIDLPFLSVAAYGFDGGTNNNDVAKGLISITNPAGQTNQEILRIIVVGRNSFNGTAPHLVFQFKHLPGKHRMEMGDTNANGYLGSEMREYLVGNYLAGLAAAGVPEALLWAPTRLVANRGNNVANGTHAITDKLWLPTEREMFGTRTNSHDLYETEENQARLEYYADATSRKKLPATSTTSFGVYWEASPAKSISFFCTISVSGSASGNQAFIENGCAPAFCVSGAP